MCEECDQYRVGVPVVGRTVFRLPINQSILDVRLLTALQVLQGRAHHRLLDRYVFNDVEQCSTTALFTARADGSSASPAPQDFCKACLWQVTDASIDLRDPNMN